MNLDVSLRCNVSNILKNAGFAGFIDGNKRYTSMISSSLLALVRVLFIVWVVTARGHMVTSSRGL